MAEVDLVLVWSIDTGVAAPDLTRVLDDDERRRATVLERAQDRRRFVAAHGAVRLILGERLGVAPAALRWRYGPHGKPELAGPPPAVRTSLSHSGDVALFAVTDRRAVGVDVQAALPDRDALRMAARYFPVEESRGVTSGDAFARLWVRKEACVKAAGLRLVQGLSLPVAGPDDALVVRCEATEYRVRDLPMPPGRCAAVALAGAAAFRVVHRSWPPPARWTGGTG